MVSLVLLSAALVMWPSVLGRRQGLARRQSHRPNLRWLVVGWTLVVGIGTALLSTVVAGCAGAALTWTVAAMAVEARRRRDGDRDLDEAESAVRALLRELKAGAAADRALQMVAAEFPRFAAGVSGGESPAAATDHGLAEIGRRVSDSAILATRLGLPWARVLASVADDLRSRAGIRTTRAAAMAGPRLSGWVLAGLPIVGVVLGYGMGADPLQVLLATGIGQVLLVVGTALTCAGLWWVRRLCR